MERIMNSLPTRIFLILMVLVSLSLFGCGGDPAPSQQPEDTGDETNAVDDNTAPPTDESTATSGGGENEPDEVDPLAPIEPPAIEPAIVTPGDQQPEPIPLGGPTSVEAQAGNPYTSEAADHEVVGGMSIDAPPPLIAPPIQAED